MPFPDVGDVVIVGAARTPIGRYGGSLRNVHPADLGAAAAKAAMARAGVSPDAIDEVLIGHGRQAGSAQSCAPGRHPGRRARYGPRADDQQGVRLGHADDRDRSAVHHARRGGRHPRRRYRVDEPHAVLVDAEDARWGHKMGNFTLVDAMYARFHLLGAA